MKSITRRQLRKIIKEYYEDMLAKGHVDGSPWSGSLENLATIQGKTWGHGAVVDPKGWEENISLAKHWTRGTARSAKAKKLNEEQMTLNQSGVDAVLAMADQIEPMFQILRKTAGQSSAAEDPLYDKLEDLFLDLPGWLEDIAEIMKKQGVEGGLRENRSPLGTDEEIADKLIQNGKFAFKQRDAVIAGLKKLDPSYKQKMSDISSNVKVGY